MLEAMPDGTYKLEWLVGTKKIEPLIYRLEERVIKRSFWFDKKEYWVTFGFGKLGPFDKKEEALYHIRIASNV